jgi:hypothetical protein
MCQFLRGCPDFGRERPGQWFSVKDFKKSPCEGEKSGE